MAESSDDTEKTEEPTQRRISEAVKKGQVSFSREVTNFLMLLVLTLNIVWFAPYYMSEMTFNLSKFINSAHNINTDLGNLTSLTKETLSDLAILMILPIIATVAAAILSSLLQNGVVLSTESITPKLEKISLFKGIKRLFSLRSFMEFIKGLVKLSIVVSVCYLAVKSELIRLEELVSYEIMDILDVLITLSFKVAAGAAGVMAIIAFLDFLYQKFEYIKSLKMSKQEIKEEYKQSEGDPQIKSKLRQIRMERAQKRMMSAVPNADVIIRNPTHFAIALKYDQKEMPAPIVLAVGKDNIALKIIEVAKDNKVPTVTNKPLARALYESSEIDQEIPLEHYQAVAEVIGYIYKLKGKSRG